MDRGKLFQLQKVAQNKPPEGYTYDIYSTVDACPNASEMWIAIEKLKQGGINQCSRILKLICIGSLENSHHGMVNHLNRITQRSYSIIPEGQKVCDSVKAEVMSCRVSPITNFYDIPETTPIELDADQADWRDDTDDEPDDQELEAHYMYMAQLQEVTPDVADNFRPIFNSEPLQEVQNDDDHYNVIANNGEHPVQPKPVNDTYLEEQSDTNITIDSLDMSTNGEIVDEDDDDLANERDLLATLIDKLNVKLMTTKTISDMKKELVAHQKTISIVSQQKEDQMQTYKTRKEKELEKVIALENKIKLLDDIVYLTSQSVQTMNMLNRNCKTSFVKPEFLKKAQRANPHLYDIGCYNDNLALILAPDSNETIRLAQES
ncbi:hypothetical protein Tco_0152514 [Tanacetum coccineum]